MSDTRSYTFLFCKANQEVARAGLNDLLNVHKNAYVVIFFFCYKTVFFHLRNNLEYSNQSYEIQL